MRSTWAKVAHTGGATIVSLAGSVVGLAITARVLGPAGRGAYAAALSWVALFATLGTLSIGQVIVHHVAGRDESDWLDEVTGSAGAIVLGATAVGALVLGTLFIATGGRLFGDLPFWTLALAFVALPFLLWADAARYILTCLGALVVSNRAQMAGAVAGLAVTAALLLGARIGLAGALGGYVVAGGVAAVMTAVYLVRRGRTLRVAGGTVRVLLRGSAQLHLNAIGNYLFTQASVLVLNYYRPSDETGQYQLAIQLFGMVLIVSNAIGAVAFELVGRHGPDRAWPEQRRLLAQATALVAAIGAVAYVAAPLAIRIVAGAAFLPAARLFQLVVPALIGATFSQVMASQWIGRGLFLQAALLTFAVGAVSLTCDLLLVPAHGARGAVVSTLVTYGISVFGNGGLAFWVQSRVRRAAPPDRTVPSALGHAAADPRKAPT